MDILDIFLNKYSYKFPKGYPDMNNEQDVLLMEGLLSELGINEKIILEKKLEWKDLSNESRKYYRLEVIANKRANGELFKLENGSEDVLTFDKDSYAALFKAQNINDIKIIGGKNINKFPFFRDSKNNNISINNLVKTKDIGGEESKIYTKERQEISLIKAINSIPGIKTLEGNNGFTISNIKEAIKLTINTQGKESYADIKLVLTNGEYLLSAKGLDAHTTAGGGLLGVTQINDNLSNFIKKFYEDVYSYYKIIFNNLNLNYNTNLYKTNYFKDINREIPQNLILDILKGNAAMGGPVDGYYIGPMEVTFTINNNAIKTNGDIIPVDKFSEKYDKLFVHIKKRDGDYYFTDKTKEINGINIPIIFTNKPDGNLVKSRFGIGTKSRGLIII